MYQILRKLPPREYSISSSFMATPDEVHITVGTVRYQAHGRERKVYARFILLSVLNQVI